MACKKDVYLPETARSISTSCRRSSMRKWRHCTFLLTVRCSPSLPENMRILPLSRLKALSRVNTTVIELIVHSNVLLCCEVWSRVLSLAVPRWKRVSSARMKGGDPRTDHIEEGDDSDPGLASRRDCVPTATASSPEAVGWAPLV